MPYTVNVICRPEIAAGFALAGLRPAETGAPDETATRVREAFERPQTGVVLLEQARYDALPEELVRRLGRQPVPLVVPFPGPVWEARPAEAEAYIVELLRQVIGYRVRLR